MLTTRSTHAAHLTPTAAVPAIGRTTQLCRMRRTSLCGLLRLPSFQARHYRRSAPTAAQETASGRDQPVQSVSPELQQSDWSPPSLSRDPLEDDDKFYQLEGLSDTQQAPEATPRQPEQEDLSLVPNTDGYQVIELEGCDFLLAITSDGRLDLSHAYVQDDESGIYAQPDVTSGEVPATAQHYSLINWQEEYLGDVVFEKPPKFLVKRVYLVHVSQLEPRRLDLETVWVLDGERRSIYKAQVDRSTDSQDPTEMILRIRRDGRLVIDSAAAMPSPDELILEIDFGEDAKGAEASPQRWRMDDPEDRLNDPIEAIGDDFDEPDVPAVDLA